MLQDLMDERLPFRGFRYARTGEDGAVRCFSANGIPVFDDAGRFMGYHGTVTDRTLPERQSAIVNLMSTISYAANQSVDKNETLEQCLALICRFTGWEVGHVYTAATDGSNVLEPSPVWFLSDPERFADFKRATAESTFDPGAGLPGLAFSRGEPFWKNFNGDDEKFERAAVGAAVGLVGGVGFPVIVRDKVVAILEFFSLKPIVPVDDLFDTLRHVCTQISRVMEREQNQAALRDHRDQLQQMVDAATEDLKDKAEELRVALESEQQVNAQQRQFVLMASHEFRTPLAIIDSAAQRLKRRAGKNNVSAEDAVERSERISGAVQRMTRLIDSTLSAFRMQEGSLKIELGSCDIAKLITEVSERQQEISAKHVISRNLDGLPASITADAGALELVLGNLLSNAVKYSPDGGSIEVEARQDGDHVLIAVRDQGIGIDADEVAKIGTRYFRAKTASGIAGTGIGLNLVKNLMEHHEGSFGCRSVKGEGSTFTVRLPIAGPSRPKEQAA